MSDSERVPSLSTAFHVGRSPDSMIEAIHDLGRHGEAVTRTLKSHWLHIGRIDGAVQAQSTSIQGLTLKVVKLETRVAIYAGLGSFVGGTLVAVVLHFWK